MITRHGYQLRQVALERLHKQVSTLSVPAWAAIFRLWLLYVIEREQFEIGLLMENGFVMAGVLPEAVEK